MYLLDANVLIEAKSRYYAFDIAPGFWTWLDTAHHRALACSIDAVRDELRGRNDELGAWARTRWQFFRPIDQDTTSHFGHLSSWAYSRGFTPSAIAEFTGNNTDYLLIAYARAHRHTVVTHDISQPTTGKRILVPDACIAMGVTTANTFHMLRQTGARLDLRLENS